MVKSTESGGAETEHRLGREVKSYKAQTNRRRKRQRGFSFESQEKAFRDYSISLKDLTGGSNLIS